MCSCGECEVKGDHQCEGKNYHTREVLRCPFHRLAYQIECDERIKMADQLVHPKLHRGLAGGLAQRVAEIQAEAPIPREAPLSCHDQSRPPASKHDTRVQPPGNCIPLETRAFQKDEPSCL